MRKIFFIILFLGILFFAKDALAATNVYYSVGQNSTDHKTGSPTLTIASGVATFSEAQTATNLGVGDRVTYGSGTSTYAFISAKQSTSVWNVVTATGAEPTATTSATVISIAHEYTSLSAAEAGAFDTDHINNADLTVAQTVLNLPAYYDSGADTTAVTVAGATTSAAYYIKIYTPNNTLTEVNQSQRHNGKWNDGKYKLVRSSGNAISLSGGYVKVEGLQLTPGSSGDGIYSGSTNSVSVFDVYNNIIKSPTGVCANGMQINTTSYTRVINVWNNIIYGFTCAGYDSLVTNNATNTTVYAYNNTITNNNYGPQKYGSPGTFIAKNNISYNNTDNYRGNFGAASTNNLSGPTQTDAPGSNPRNGVTVQFVDAANKDFHLRIGDSSARGGGANLKNDANLAFDTDIDNENRPETGNWDIGADEVARTTQINTPLSGRFIDSSLKGYWSFDGADMDWSQTTAEARDLSGNANHGDVVNFDNKSSVPGINGQALSFDGGSTADDYVNAGSAAVLDNMSAFSVSAWVYGKSYGENSQGYIVNKSNTGSLGWRLQYLITGNVLEFGVDYDGTNLEVDTGNLSSTWNKWTQWTVTWDGSTSTSNVHIYKDGVEVSYVFSQNAVGNRVTDDAQNLIIGNNIVGAPNRTFDGLIDEVRIYNRALSASEIAEQYRAGAARLKANTPITNAGPQSGLVGNWSFNGQDTTWTSATAGTTTDLSGNGNTGVMMNMSRSFSPAIGKVGQALSFDGTNDYIFLSSNPLSSMAASSVSMWVKLNNLLVGSGAFSQTFLNLYTNASNQLRIGHAEDIAAGCIFVSYSSGGSLYGRQTNGGKVTANTWYHIVYTVGPAGLNIYVNGVDSDTGANTNSNGAVNVIGARSNVSGTTNGLIDEVRIYNRALSTDEILELYRLGTRKFQPTQ